MTVGEYIHNLGAQQLLNPLQIVKCFMDMYNLNEDIDKQNLEQLKTIIEKYK